MALSAAPVVTALGVGIALAGAPGPVQAILLTESVRGGARLGIRALVGVHATFGALLLAVALGVSLGRPEGAVLRALEIAGGLLLLWLALDGLRSSGRWPAANGGGEQAAGRRRLPPVARGALAIVLNPGGWLFLAAVAAPLFAAAERSGGRATALLAALGLLLGALAGDLAVVLLGATGLRRANARIVRTVTMALAVVLGALGVWLVLRGVLP